MSDYKNIQFLLILSFISALLPQALTGLSGKAEISIVREINLWLNSPPGRRSFDVIGMKFTTDLESQSLKFSFFFGINLKILIVLFD